MPKPRTSRKGSIPHDRYSAIELAASKRKKAELVDLLMNVAREVPDACQILESALQVEKPVNLAVFDIEAAMVRATDFDERMLNRNFDYDRQAYIEVKQGFEQLIALGHLDEVKVLAMRLMALGSRQVECSDEGMMTGEIEACLKPVIRAVAEADLDKARSWAASMKTADRVAFLCYRDLDRLAGE